MQIERIALRLRPRNAWEALDLGIALVRSNGARVYGAWLAAYLPAAFIVYALLWERPFLAWIVLWWLKPLFDRVILAMLSRALFDEAPSVREVLGSPRQWLLGTRVIAALTWGRFDLARSFHLPVHQLERSRGKPGRQRVRLLDRDARGAAVWLTFLLFFVELSLMIGTGLALAFLVPVQVPVESIVNAIVEAVFLGGAGLGEGALAGSMLGTLAVSLIEPMYVAAGFTLYLQRRTMLEGWDIELRFRNLADRIAAAAPRMAATLAALAIGCALLAGAPQPALAQQPPKNAAEEIKKVMAAPEFGKEETRKGVKYIGPSWEPKESKRSTMNWEWLEKLVLFFSEAGRFLAWTAGAVALAIALYFLARHLRLRVGGGRARSRPDFLFGLDVRPESLPDDVAAAAAALAREGRTREALSLLYRGALVRFLEQGLEFLRGDTEGDCQRKVDRAAPQPTRDFFRRLVNAWQSLAYGHRSVGADDVLALAGEWQRQFAPATEAAR